MQRNCPQATQKTQLQLVRCAHISSWLDGFLTRIVTVTGAHGHSGPAGVLGHLEHLPHGRGGRHAQQDQRRLIRAVALDACSSGHAAAG